jgi:S1-C subfamily serine protease
MAGIVAGDVITGFGGQPVESADALSNLLNHERPGATGLLTWTALDGGRHEALVTLSAGPAGLRTAQTLRFRSG